MLVEAGRDEVGCSAELEPRSRSALAKSDAGQLRLQLPVVYANGLYRVKKEWPAQLGF